MAHARRAHAAVLLGDGRVLVASGFNNVVGEVPAAEIYDPATGTWSAVAPPLVPRHYASLNLLPDGRALLAGGWTGPGATTHAELYDPAANTWTATGPMNFPRNGAMGTPLAHATVLPSGLVLMVGGSDTARAAQPDAELYDRTTGTWTIDGSMGVGRENGSAHLLPDGDVLLTGGFAQQPATTFYASVERYTPDVPAGPAPVVNAVPLLQRHGAALTLTGAGFTGALGASTPQLHLQRVGNGAITLWGPASHTDASFTSPPLGALPAGLYMARVVVDGVPSAAALVRFTDPAGTPGGTAGNGQVTVSWTSPAYTGGNPPEGYAATASPGGAGCTAVAPATSCTVTGLTNGTPYTFTVRALHPNGEGPVSQV
ncbi:kelch repeat-containing protein, partial [Pulveribacter sp.]